MQIRYDRQADALSVDLAPGAKSAKTTALALGVNIDFDVRGRLIGVEVLRASDHYAKEELAKLGAPVDELTLIEAAKESGISSATLRVQVNRGRLKGRKQGRDWLISRAALWTYLENRDPRGRRSETERSK